MLQRKPANQTLSGICAPLKVRSKDALANLLNNPDFSIQDPNFQTTDNKVKTPNTGQDPRKN